MQPFPPLKLRDHRRLKRVVHKDLTNETLFDVDIIDTVTDAVYNKDNHKDDPVEVNTSQSPDTGRVKILKLRYVEQRLTAFSNKIMKFKR